MTITANRPLNRIELESEDFKGWASMPDRFNWPSIKSGQTKLAFVVERGKYPVMHERDYSKLVAFISLYMSGVPVKR